MRLMDCKYQKNPVRMIRHAGPFWPKSRRQVSKPLVRLPKNNIQSRQDAKDEYRSDRKDAGRLEHGRINFKTLGIIFAFWIADRDDDHQQRADQEDKTHPVQEWDLIQSIGGCER